MSETRKQGRDFVNEAAVGMSSIHANIHRGVFYSFIEQAVLGADSVTDILIRPAVGQSVHLRIGASVQQQMLVALYEGTTFSAAGAAFTAQNRNRCSTRAHQVQLSLGPTITDDGSEIGDFFIPGGTSEVPLGGQFAGFEEWILVPGDVYLLRLSNNIVTPAAAARFGLSFNFYEPEV